MITIIFAPPGFGKTSLLTHILNSYAYNSSRNRRMREEIISKQDMGFKDLTVPIHCVSANYDCVFKKFGYSNRYNRRINPYRLGFKNDFVSTHFNLPYEVIGITEAQKYLNSRISVYFPDWQSRWYEQHRHNDLDIYLDTQRPMLIDVNIRELARFIEIVNLDVHKDKYGKVKMLKWKIRLIENSSLFDRYMASGKKDKDCYTEYVITANYNVFECFNSQSCKPKFYAGHEQGDFDYIESEPLENTKESYVRYLEQFDDELPKNYYQRRKQN